MKYCKTCLQPDTRPNSYFHDDGICPACKYYHTVSAVADWQERLDDIQEVLENYKRKPGQHFDCIIGVSGGKDSTRQALWVRDKLGLKPLLVCLTYPPEQLTERGVDNISNLIELGFDVVISALSPQMWKRLLRKGFFRFTNWARGSEQAILAAVPQLAIRYDIKIIFWGENPGLQLGDLKTVGKTGYDGNNLKYMNTVSGGALDWLLEEGFESKKLNPYLYPVADEFDTAKIQIIYLGWFWRDWSLINNAAYSCVNGLEIRDDTVENTGDLWGVTSLDEDWVTLNQMIKYYKYGFGRVSDYANEEIRQGRSTRDDAIKLVENFDDSCSDEYIQSFCDYIDITKEEFWAHVHKSVNKDLFTIEKDGTITRKYKVGIGL
jgi:N-acetyl sugar amidotransferase